MISLTLKDNRLFMSHLLIKETFDNYQLSEADISTANTYSINGQINPDYYDKEEYENLANKKYSLWHEIKPFCYSLIKGNKTPALMKIIFLLPHEDTIELIQSSGTEIAPEDVNGLFINIRYSNGHTHIITGTSVKSFSMDKSLDKAFDEYVKKMLLNAGIDFEEI